MNITKFINAARKESEKSKSPEYWVGAVIVNGGGEMVGTGHNRTSAKINRWEKRFNIKLWSLHAEVDAIMNCDYCAGTTMFVSGRKARNGNKINCRPCGKCWKIMKFAKIRGVFYETLEGVIYEEVCGRLQ